MTKGKEARARTHLNTRQTLARAKRNADNRFTFREIEKKMQQTKDSDSDSKTCDDCMSVHALQTILNARPNTQSRHSI